jgi:ComF family protein
LAISILLSIFSAQKVNSSANFARQGLRALLPQSCHLCAAPAGTALLCAGCAASLPMLSARRCPCCALPTSDGSRCGSCLRTTPAFDATTAAFIYAFPVDELIQALKYRGRLALAEWGADALCTALAAETVKPDLLVAMPLSRARQKERGYNQALEIARSIAPQTGVPLLRHGVVRIKDTPPQAMLPWKERAKNIRGAFACESDLQGKTIAVVDDVMTTGASLNELARTLKKAGAARVENWVVARTLPPNSGAR